MPHASGGVLALRCDVADPASCAEAVATTVERLGGLHVLANIAGVGSFASTHDLALDDWNRTLAVNLTGTFLMSQAALDPLLETGGAIVNMASVSGLRGCPTTPRTPRRRVASSCSPRRWRSSSAGRASG